MDGPGAVDTRPEHGRRVGRIEFIGNEIADGHGRGRIVVDDLSRSVAIRFRAAGRFAMDQDDLRHADIALLTGDDVDPDPFTPGQGRADAGNPVVPDITGI